MSFFDENQHSREDALYFYGSVTLPENKRDALEKSAADLSFVVPGLMGLGAAGTAGYLGMREAKSRGKIRALEEAKNDKEREAAIARVNSDSVRKAAPVAALAGAGAGYLTGAHVPEHLIRSTTDAAGRTVERTALKDLSTKQKILHAPGALFQRGLDALGAKGSLSHVGKGLAGVAAIGAGLYAGSKIGKGSADEQIKRMREGKEKTSALRSRIIRSLPSERMEKSAGLFLKPSDLADSHHDLSAALEQTLNNSPGQSQFKKHAGRAESAMIGAVVGGSMETIRRKNMKPIEPPPVEDVKGAKGLNKLKSRGNRAYQRMRYEHDQFSRKHPVHATLIAMGTGAAAGAMTNLGSNAVQVAKSLRGKT